jgi:hypothetical protein
MGLRFPRIGSHGPISNPGLDRSRMPQRRAGVAVRDAVRTCVQEIKPGTRAQARSTQASTGVRGAPPLSPIEFNSAWISPGLGMARSRAICAAPFAASFRSSATLSSPSIYSALPGSNVCSDRGTGRSTGAFGSGADRSALNSSSPSGFPPSSAPCAFPDRQPRSDQQPRFGSFG